MHEQFDKERSKHQRTKQLTNNQSMTTEDSDTASGPLERYMSLLELVAAFPGELTSTDVANGLQLPKSTVHRLLRVLARSGLVEGGDNKARQISLGGRLTRLLHASRGADWIEAATLPHLAQAAMNYADACYYLSCLSGHRVFVVSSACGDPKWRSYIETGQEISQHAGASAKIILAYQSDKILEAALSGPLTAFTTDTCTDPKLVKKEIRKASKLGYATCINEINDGMSALAVPIFLRNVGVIYSVGITGPITKRITQELPRLLLELQQLADVLTNILSLRDRQQSPVDVV
jgi:DNA-binding IclR family transcriptional regulator